MGGGWSQGAPIGMENFGLRLRLLNWLARPRGESAVVAGARLVSAGCSLFIAIISARHLGPSGRGEIVFVLTVCHLGSEFVSLGANVSGRIRILRQSGVSIEDYLGLVMVLALAQAVLMAVILGGVGSIVLDLSLLTCVLGSLLGVTMFFAYMLVDAAFALRRTLETGLRDLLIGVTPVIPLVALYAFGELSVALVIGFTTVGYLVGGRYLWTVVRRRIDRVRFSPPAWKTIIRSGLPVLGGTFGQTLAFRADRLVLGLLASSATLGVFSVGAAAAELPRLLLLPVTQIFANRVATGEITMAGVRSLSLRLSLGYSAIMLAVGLLGARVVLPLVGEEFSEARDLIAVLALSEALLGVYFVSAAALTGLGRFRRLPAPAIAGAIFLIVADALVVSAHGGQGVAWVRVFGFGIMAVFALISLGKVKMISQ